MALQDVPGVGPATVAKLQHAGIQTERGLARARPERIAEATGTTVARASGWIQAAKELIGTPATEAPSETPTAHPATVEAERNIGDRKPKESGSRLVGDIFLGLDLGYLGLTVLATLILGAVLSGTATESNGESLDTGFLLWLTNVHNLLVFAVIPIAWVVLSHVGGWRAMVPVLGLRWNGMVALWGVVVAIGMLAFAIAAGYLVDTLGWAPENPPIEGALAGITWPLVIVTSIVAGFAEEVMFRGVLQKWLRWWGQGLVFGVLHFGNAGLISFAITAVIGLSFGYMRHRGASLWTLIIAHFLYDFVLLSALMVAPDLVNGDETAWLRW